MEVCPNAPPLLQPLRRLGRRAPGCRCCGRWGLTRRDVQVAMVTAQDLLLCLQQGCHSHRGARQGRRAAPSLEHPVQGARGALVGAQSSLPAGSWGGRVHGAVSLCFPLHPPSGSTGTGRGWLEEGEKTGSEICVLNRLFLERAFPCLFMREEFLMPLLPRQDSKMGGLEKTNNSVH